MKSTHGAYIEKKAAKNFVSVGKAFNTVKNYTKDDIKKMTPAKVGEMFGISTQQARDLMKSLYRRNASFVLNDHRANIILQPTKGCIYLHPLALEAFKQHLSNQKG